MEYKKKYLFKINFKKVVLLLSFLGTNFLMAQVKIGDSPEVINPSSLLELESNSKAMVLSRVTSAQMQAITPLQGAIVYNTDMKCVFYFNSSTWNNLCNNGGSNGGATIVDNNDGTYTFTDGNGVETIISFSGAGGSVQGEPGSIFFAGANRNSTENNTQLFWDETNQQLGIGTNSNLTDKLNVNGTIGTSDGSALEPSYRYSQDSDTGIFRSGENELGISAGGLEKLRVTNSSVRLNKAEPFNTHPLIIRASNEDEELLALQNRQGVTKWHIDLNGPGLNFILTGVGNNRLFLSNLDDGKIAIHHNQPEETLDINGTLRVRGLTPAATGENLVSVDANGTFHIASNNQAAKNTNGKTHNNAGRWTNSASKSIKKGNGSSAPIFGNEDYKDGGASTFVAQSATALLIKESGRYDIRANISVIGVNSSPLQINARIMVSNSPVGAISTAASTGSKNTPSQASLHFNEVLQLKGGDVITIRTNANTSGVHYNDKGTSSFMIAKVF